MFVTGVGTVSALGVGVGADVVEALARTPAIGPIRAFPTAGLRSHLGAEVGDLTPYLTPEEVRRLSRVCQLAVVACRLAMADAGVEAGALPGLGLVLGSQWGDFRSSEEFARGYLARGPLGLSPMIFPNTVMNAMAALAAINLGARGPMLTVNQAGIAGELAVARAAGLVAAGRAPAVLAGGVDELCPIVFRELTRLGTTSPRGAGPEGCWPFDRRANGTVLGEGATTVLLETEDSARARGARVYADLTGVAWGNLPAPAHGFPTRRRRAPAVIRRALAGAGREPAEVDAVYLTGSGDPTQDVCELDLIGVVFGTPGASGPRLTALTPLAGDHAGLGVLAVAGAAVATLGGGRLPPLPDLRTPVRGGFAFATNGGAGSRSAQTVLVHGLARGGGHVALLLERAGAARRERAAA